MYFGGFLRPRPGTWPLRMAIRATVTAAAAIVAAVTIESSALPRLQAESKGLKAAPPATLKWLGAFQDHLPYVPVPAVLLGAAAIGFRPARPALAVAASAASVLSLFIIVATLVAAMAPLYNAPRDLTLP